MMETLLEMVQQFWLGFQRGQLPDLGGWNYMLMGLFIMIQGRSSAVVGGIAAAAGYLNLGLIIMVALVARLIVDLFWYKVGATGYVDRIGRRVGPYERITGRFQEGIHDSPNRLVLLAKLTSGLSIPVVLAVGNAHVPFRRWLPASFVGELLWTLPFLLLGFFATDAVADMEGGLSYLTMGLSAFVFLFLIVKAGRSKWLDARRESRHP